MEMIIWFFSLDLVNIVKYYCFPDNEPSCILIINIWSQHIFWICCWVQFAGGYFIYGFFLSHSYSISTFDSHSCTSYSSMPPYNQDMKKTKISCPRVTCSLVLEIDRKPKRVQHIKQLWRLLEVNREVRLELPLTEWVGALRRSISIPGKGMVSIRHTQYPGDHSGISDIASVAWVSDRLGRWAVRMKALWPKNLNVIL